jgi:hypothetical protein
VNVRYNWKPFWATWRQVFTYSIIYCKDNIKCDSASNAPKFLLNNDGVHCSKTCQTLKHFDNVFATAGNNIVEVFESLTSFWTMDTPLFSGHLGPFDVIHTITNAIHKKKVLNSLINIPVGYTILNIFGLHVDKYYR